MMIRMGQISLHCVLLALLVVMTATAQRTNCSNILRGRDGIPGREGRDGRDGLQGPIGPQGPIGVRGEKGDPGEFPGEKGEKGVPGVIGNKGEKGQVGEKGKTGKKGSKGAVGPSGQGDRGFAGEKGSKGDAGSGGVTYVRWGRTVCPQGTSTVYTGVVVGSAYDAKGGPSDHLCLSDKPQYKARDNVTNAGQFSRVWVGNSGDTSPVISQYANNLPCALCHTTTKSTSFMLPGRYTCPLGWNTEYSGYLMSDWTDNQREGRSNTICVDQAGEATGTRRVTTAAWIFLTKVYCAREECPPFVNNKPLTCAVCSK